MERILVKNQTKRVIKISSNKNRQTRNKGGKEMSKKIAILVIILSILAFSGYTEKPVYIGYFVINETAYDVTLDHRVGGHELNILEDNQSLYIHTGNIHNAYILNNRLVYVEERDYNYVYFTVLYENGKFASKPIPVP